MFSARSEGGFAPEKYTSVGTQDTPTFLGSRHVRTLHTSIKNVNGTLQIEGAAPTKPYDICNLLAQHRISLAAWSEVRWKGTGSILLGNYLCLFPGLPETAPVSLHGVGIVMDPFMTAAWRLAGSQVTYAGARLMKIALRIQKRNSHVISVYAPKFRASDQDKEDFYRELRTLVNSCWDVGRFWPTHCPGVTV